MLDPNKRWRDCSPKEKCDYFASTVSQTEKRISQTLGQMMPILHGSYDSSQKIIKTPKSTIKVQLLKADNPTNFNSKNHTLYVNPNDSLQYVKLKEILKDK